MFFNSRFLFFSKWSAQILYDKSSLTLYNLLFTMAPPFALCLLAGNQEEKQNSILKNPRQFRLTQESQHFNLYTVGWWIVQAVLHSLVIFAGAFFFLGHENLWGNEGRTLSFLGFGQYVYTFVLITVCMKVSRVIATNSNWKRSVNNIMHELFFFFRQSLNQWPCHFSLSLPYG